MSRFLYFAYGSNMLAARLRERTPSARPVAVAGLPGHALRWHKPGLDGSGKCDVVAVADPAACVHGVLYEIARAEKPQLDRAESLGVGYAERHAPVQVTSAVAFAGQAPRRAGDGWRTVEALLYVALRVDAGRLPFDWYRALVVAGAREHALPADYVAALEATPARADPEPGRARRHLELIAGPRR